MLHYLATHQQDDIAGKSACLAEIVRCHDDFDAGHGDRLHDLLNALGRCRIEAGGGLIKKQDLWVCRECSRQCQALLLAAGKSSCRAILKTR